MVKSITTIQSSMPQVQKIRTAAYCRVSSDSTDQLHSFAAQVRYYTRIISDNEGMELVDIYADEGITGTKTQNRDDFRRLINDCKMGKIDRVLTKSVSRFARNTVDSIMYARLLKENGVSILFEKEYIETALYLILVPNTGLLFVYCSIYCGFVGASEPAHCGLSLICRLNLQADSYR